MTVLFSIFLHVNNAGLGLRCRQCLEIESHLLCVCVLRLWLFIVGVRVLPIEMIGWCVPVLCRFPSGILVFYHRLKNLCLVLPGTDSRQLPPP